MGKAEAVHSQGVNAPGNDLRHETIERLTGERC